MLINGCIPVGIVGQKEDGQKASPAYFVIIWPLNRSDKNILFAILLANFQYTKWYN